MMNEDRKTKGMARSCVFPGNLVNNMLHAILSKRTGAGKTALLQNKLRGMLAGSEAAGEVRAANILNTAVACVLGQTRTNDDDSAVLRMVDARVRTMVADDRFDTGTFAVVGRYLMLRYMCPYTPAEDKPALKTLLLRNLYMFEATLNGMYAEMGEGRRGHAGLEFDIDELSIFNPNHRLLCSLNVLRHYYGANLSNHKACGLFQKVIEALEPISAEMAPENRLYVAFILKRLRQRSAWPDHLPSEVIFCQAMPAALAAFERQATGKKRAVYKSPCRHYLVTSGEFFLSL